LVSKVAIKSYAQWYCRSRELLTQGQRIFFSGIRFSGTMVSYSALKLDVRGERHEKNLCRSSIVFSFQRDKRARPDLEHALQFLFTTKLRGRQIPQGVARTG
jgi:hypothetical protein